MAIIYGIDTEKPVHPKDVRDAMVECFTQAHASALEDFGQDSSSMSPEELNNIQQISVRQLIRHYFETTNGDFDQPTRDSILNVMEKLKDFAANFRDQTTIQKHYQEITSLVALLPNE